MYHMVEIENKPFAGSKKHSQSPIKSLLQMKFGQGIIQRKIEPIKSATELSTFLISEDVDKIKRYCMEKSYIISFREAGEHTIRRLMDGAAAKGHHILEKSIKEGSIGQDDIGSIPKEVRGLVGVWDKSKKGLEALLGVYMSRKGIAKMKSSPEGAEIVTDGQKVLFDSLAEFLAVGSSDKTAILSAIAAKLKDKDDKVLEYSDFVTGDYDLHDVLFVQRNETTRGALITPAHAVKEGLNEVLNGERRPHSEFDKVQHGPQSDYGKYIAAHRGESVTSSLLRPDVGGEPEKRIAVCGPDGVWYILRNRVNLTEYYAKWELNANIVWPEEGAGLELREKSIQVVRGGK